MRQFNDNRTIGEKRCFGKAKKKRKKKLRNQLQLTIVQNKLSLAKFGSIDRRKQIWSRLCRKIVINNPWRHLSNYKRQKSANDDPHDKTLPPDRDTRAQLHWQKWNSNLCSNSFELSFETD
jgi:hypothetical protein